MKCTRRDALPTLSPTTPLLLRVLKVSTSTVQHSILHCILQHPTCTFALLHVMDSAEEDKKAATSVWEVWDASSAVACLALSATFSCGWETALP